MAEFNASFNSSCTLVWGSGRKTFRLDLGAIEELQTKTDCGPAELFLRLRTGAWRVNEPREIIRLGLIGGGMSPIDAFREVERYCFAARPLNEALPVAELILAAALAGVADDPPGKPEAAGEETGASPAATGSGASRTSTLPESASSASAPTPSDA